MEKLSDLENGGHDIVYPLYILDTCAGGMQLIAWSMRFNDVLDADKLQSSLTRLLEIGDWRKLGGRMKKVQSNKKGKPTRWEVHCPAVYTEQRAAISFSHDTHAIDIDNHPQARDFAKPTENITTFRINNNVRGFQIPDGFPKDFKQWLAQEWPQLTLKVSTFNDATMVTLIWPHYLLDGASHECIMRNWARVLSGNEDAVDPFLGAHQDVLERVDQSEEKSREPLYLDAHNMTIWQKIMYIWPILLAFILGRAAELRMIYIPQSVFARLKEHTMVEAREAASESGLKDSFVSDGDILTAWFLHATQRNKSNENKAVNVTQVVDVRPRLDFINHAPGVFIQNMYVLSYAFLTAEQAAGSIGSIALLHRQAMIKGLAETHLLTYLRDIRSRLHNNKMFNILLGNPAGRPLPMNSVAKAQLMTLIDFSPAVIAQGEDDETRRNPLGTMTCSFNLRVNGEMHMVPSSVYNWGKDHGRGYWLSQALAPKDWEHMMQELQKLELM